MLTAAETIEARIEGYYVIYTVDADESCNLRWYQPFNLLKKRDGLRIWAVTEAYDHDEYGVFVPGKHRKYVAELLPAEFHKFVCDMGLKASRDETGGSLTIEYGWLPAISFDGYGYQSGTNRVEAFLNAYVTPLVQDTPEDPEDLWYQVKDWVVERYG
jgi:hypothetical protein